MSARALLKDVARLNDLRSARAALASIDVKVVVPRISWRVGKGSVENTIVERAAAGVVRAQWTRQQFRATTLAALDAGIAAIVAKYPGVDLGA